MSSSAFNAFGAFFSDIGEIFSSLVLGDVLTAFTAAFSEVFLTVDEAVEVDVLDDVFGIE